MTLLSFIYGMSFYFLVVCPSCSCGLSHCRQSSLSKEAERDNGKVRAPKRRGCCYRSMADSFVIGVVVGAFVPFRSPADLVIDEGGMIR